MLSGRVRIKGYPDYTQEIEDSIVFRIPYTRLECSLVLLVLGFRRSQMVYSRGFNPRPSYAHHSMIAKHPFYLYF